MKRESIFSKVKSLVSKFEANKYHYLSKNYLEEEVKIDFINPLFEALGWDVRNTQGLSPFERDVVVEKGETLGRPDYNFRIDGQTKFFVEVKAPHEPLHKINHVLQAKSYAWNTKSVFIVLLTDFEEFRLFDATIKPDPKNADQGLIFELTYNQYLDNLDKLALLSKEEVKEGSIEKLILKDSESKKLRKPVDESFLADISKWREELAKNIYKNNMEELEDKTDEGRTKIQVKILNEAVQKILDRLIFIRIAEDRKIIEPKSLLDEVEWWKAGGKRRNLQKRITDRFMGWNQDFNGEILKPGPCDVLDINSNLLAKIIERLYFPKCPYRFEVIGVELLGSIYERYLGKTIRATPKRVKVEEKPEIRKAGGVYYTPQYIVDYIIKNTVGIKIKGKTPKQLERIKILDPACGSGSFLLTAFQTLIDYHLDYYEKSPEESGSGTLFPDVIKDFNGKKRLSIEKKAHILRNNIFGVDIDPQAVEITMMSLYLKCLEGERDLPRKKELLPSLAKNIRCGNSLISYDIFDQQTLFDEENKESINPFDWYSKTTGFGEIIEQGGFDIVIGNPPYGFHQIHSKIAKRYFKTHYLSSSGSFEHYFLFYEKSLTLLKKKGLHGFIVPVTWLTIPSAKSLRKVILENYSIKEISWLPELVFATAKVNTLISIIENAKPKNVNVKIYDTLSFHKPPKEKRIYKQSHFIDLDYFIGIFEKKSDFNIIRKILAVSKPLEEFARPCSGYNPYEVGKGKTPEDKPQTKDTVKTKPYHSSKKLGSEWKPEIIGRDLSRYYVNITGKRWIKYGPWLAAPREPENFLGKRILVQEITGGHKRRIVAAYFEGELYHSRDVIPIKIQEETLHPFYLLGLINSGLFTWYHSKRNPKAKKQLFPKVLVSDLKKLPIRTINFNDLKEKNFHDKMVIFVDKILELKKKKNSLLPSSKKEKIEREIQITDDKIDKLVYELYGITKGEITAIEKEI